MVIVDVTAVLFGLIVAYDVDVTAVFFGLIVDVTAVFSRLRC